MIMMMIFLGTIAGPRGTGDVAFDDDVSTTSGVNDNDDDIPRYHCWPPANREMVPMVLMMMMMMIRLGTMG